MTLPLTSPELHDAFTGTAVALAGRVSESGHVWGDLNSAFALDGSGSLIAADWAGTGRYADVHLTDDETCFGMSCVATWGGTSTVITDSSGPVLIAAASPDRPSTPGSAGIYYNAVHPVFGDWQFGLDIWIEGVGTRLLTYDYPAGGLARDTPHRMGWELTGIILTIYLPYPVASGPHPASHVRRYADARWPSFIGPHLIWQLYNSGHSYNQPRFDSVEATSAPIPGYVPPPPLPAVLGVDILA